MAPKLYTITRNNWEVICLSTLIAHVQGKEIVRGVRARGLNDLAQGIELDDGSIVVLQSQSFHSYATMTDEMDEPKIYLSLGMPSMAEKAAVKALESQLKDES